ncbi:MAG: hypothetical protein HC902_02870 [Calothrix sp. SM1_5_4]|nr:hypothetical protein [Calothrix sp. SM1_5_4]
MHPRLKVSRKWTPLPPELIEQIQSVFRQNFREHIGDGVVEAGGRIYPSEILVQVGFRSQGSLRQSNFEISLEYNRNKDNVLKLLHLTMDAAGALFEQFFAAENDHDFPRIWEEVDFEGRKIFVQYTTTNSDLEAQADQLLGLDAAEDLAQGEWDDDVDARTIKASLGLSDEDSEGPEESDPEPPRKKNH